MPRQRIFSGIRPSGDLHIGNYLGAIKQWVKLQDDHEVVFGIMDEHAITTPHEPEALRKNTLETAMLYLAAGLDPKKVTLMVQSQVPAHVELAWILGTMTPLGELERMTQFKDKAKIDYSEIEELNRWARAHFDYVHANRELKNIANSLPKTSSSLLLKGKARKIVDFVNKYSESHLVLQKALMKIEARAQTRDKTSSGLLAYPVLMAADILLYQAGAVPVGEDQVQHVEFTRSIAERFNNRYGKTFTVPKVMLQKDAARIMALDDPAKKMSKSGESNRGYILLTDSPDAIRKKIKAAVTDSGKEIAFDPEGKPAISNLLVMFSEFSGKPIAELEAAYAGKSYAEFKTDLAEAIVSGLAPLQQKFKELESDKDSVLRILRNGSERASGIAAKTLADVKQKIGFLAA